MPVDNIAELANMLGATIQAPQISGTFDLGGSFPQLPQGTPQGPFQGQGGIGSLALPDTQGAFDLFPGAAQQGQGQNPFGNIQAPGQLPQLPAGVATQSVNPDGATRATPFPVVGNAPQAQNILAQLFSGLLPGR